MYKITESPKWKDSKESKTPNEQFYRWVGGSLYRLDDEEREVQEGGVWETGGS